MSKAVLCLHIVVAIVAAATTEEKKQDAVIGDRRYPGRKKGVRET